MTARVVELELSDRYEIPLSAMTVRVVELESKVNGHWVKMGFVWR